MKSDNEKQFGLYRSFAIPGIIALVIATTSSVSAMDDAVARVGERTISSKTIEAELGNRINTGYFHQNVSDEQLEALRNEALDELIRRELKAFAGLDAGIELPLEEAAKLAEQIETKLGAEQYQASIGLHGWDKERHIREIARTLVAQKAWGQLVEENVTVSEDRVEAAWRADPDRWVLPEQVHLRHILLRVSPSSGPEAVAEKTAVADGIVARLVGGEDFGNVAAQLSDDKFRIKGGDLGWVHRGRFLPEIEKVVWEAEIGTVQGPIRSLEGFHIVEILDRREARSMDLDEARPMIREILEKRRFEEASRQFYDDVLEDHPVEILDGDLSWSP